MTTADVFRRIIEKLRLAEIDYMLSGSFASAHYGTPRSTQDIDLVISATPAQLRTFVHSLPSNEYYADLATALEAHKRQSLFNVIDLATGWKIDLILLKSRSFSQEEFGRRQRIVLHEVSIFVASAEDVVISKLEWSKLGQSKRHVDDAAGILKLRRESLDRTYLEKWVDQLGVNNEWTDALRVAGVSR
jgi:hypothetical protein